jgi:hypothetical protein
MSGAEAVSSAPSGSLVIIVNSDFVAGVRANFNVIDEGTQLFVPNFPRVPSLEVFGRRPRCQMHRRDGLSSETLHSNGLMQRSKTHISGRELRNGREACCTLNPPTEGGYPCGTVACGNRNTTDPASQS